MRQTTAFESNQHIKALLKTTIEPMDAAQKICRDSKHNELIGFGPVISLDDLYLEGSGFSNKVEAASFLLRCIKELRTVYPQKTQRYWDVFNVSLGSLADVWPMDDVIRYTSGLLVFRRCRRSGRVIPKLHSGVSYDCLEFKLVPGCAAVDVVDFVKENSASGDELSRALDLPRVGRLVAVEFCFEIEDFEYCATWGLQIWAIATDESTIVYTCVERAPLE